MNAVRRKWARPWLLVLVVLAVAGMGGCGGGGDDDDDHDFNGIWFAGITIVQSNVSQIPVGDSGTDDLRIAQSGTNITVAVEELPLLTGTCDPAAGTLTVTGRVGSMTMQMNGVKVDDDTMSGEMIWSEGPRLVEFVWTPHLTRRSLAVSSGTSAGGLASVLRSLR